MEEQLLMQIALDNANKKRIRDEDKIQEALKFWKAHKEALEYVASGEMAKLVTQHNIAIDDVSIKDIHSKITALQQCVIDTESSLGALSLQLDNLATKQSKEDPITKTLKFILKLRKLRDLELSKLNEQLGTKEKNAPYVLCSDVEYDSLDDRSLLAYLVHIVLDFSDGRSLTEPILIQYADHLTGKAFFIEISVFSKSNSNVSLFLHMGFDHAYEGRLVELGVYDSVVIDVGRMITDYKISSNNFAFNARHFAYVVHNQYRVINDYGPNHQLPTLLHQVNVISHTPSMNGNRKLNSLQAGVDLNASSFVDCYTMCSQVWLDTYQSPYYTHEYFISYLCDIFTSLRIINRYDEIENSGLSLAFNQESDSNEYLILQNAAAIKYILNELQYTPKFVPFDVKIANKKNTLMFSKPLIQIDKEMSAKAVKSDTGYYVTNGIVSGQITEKTNTAPMARYDVSAYQYMDMLPAKSFIDEYLLYSDAHILVYIMLKVTVEYTKDIIGGMHSYSGDKTQHALRSHHGALIQFNKGPLVDRSDSYNRFYTPISFSFDVKSDAIIDLMYKKTKTTVTLSKLCVCLKNSFSAPNTLTSTGKVRITCFGTQKEIELPKGHGGIINLESGISYYGVIFPLDHETSHLFDSVLRYSPHYGAQAQQSTYKLESKMRIPQTTDSHVHSKWYYNREFAFLLSGRFFADIGPQLLFKGPPTWFNVLTSAIIKLNSNLFTNIPIHGIDIPTGDADMPSGPFKVNKFMTSCVFSLEGFSLAGKKAQSSGTGELMMIYNGALENISQNLVDITLEMNKFMSEFKTIADQLHAINARIDKQIRATESMASSRSMELILEITIGIAFTILAPGIGTALASFFITAKHFTLSALKTSSRYLAAMGFKLAEVTRSTITQQFSFMAHNSRVMIRAAVTRLDKVVQWDDVVAKSFSMAKIHAYSNISTPVKRLIPELQLAEAIRLQRPHKTKFINTFSDQGKLVPLTFEINYHGLAAIGKAEVLKKPTKDLLNSDSGKFLIHKKVAPVHAYGVVTRYEEDAAGILMTRTVLGVSEGLSPIVSDGKRISIGSIRIKYRERIEGPSTGVGVFRPLTHEEHGYTPYQVHTLFEKYFQKSTYVGSTEQMWQLIASKFASVQNGTLKSTKFFVPDTHRLDALHHMLNAGEDFRYNLITNNCQVFVTDVKAWLESGTIQASLTPYSDKLVGSYLRELGKDINLSLV